MAKKMNFRDIDKSIKTTYYNSDDDTITDFLIPILKKSKLYKRETYSFSSAIFSLIGQALSDILKNDCIIEYIVGFELEPDEINAIEIGLDESEKLIEQKIKIEFGSIEGLINQLDNRHSQDLCRYRLRILSYLISKNQLKIKVGFVVKREKFMNPIKFKFHPKVMIFEDFKGNIIVANGSVNESLGGHVRNEESFDVFKSWEKGTYEYLKRHIEKFNDFWNNKSQNIKTIDVSTLLEKKIFNNYRLESKNKEEIIDMEFKLTKIFNDKKNENIDYFLGISLWEHQKQVIDDWFRKKNLGVIKFATGAGKTKTALCALNRLYAEKRKLVTIISTPYQVLSEQWFDEVQLFFPNAKKILAYETIQNWEHSVNRAVNQFNIGIENNLIIITVNKTFSSNNFQSIIKKINDNVLLIADEVHHFNIELIDQIFSSPFIFKMGLSATPERYMDPAGTSRILEYFGGILKPEISLKDCLEKGILAHYKYHPIIVELKQDEEGSYKKISKKLEEIWKSIDNDEQRYKQAKNLLDEREMILNTASQKLVKLREKLLDIGCPNLNNSLIYCYGMSHLEEIAKMLFDLDISSARITSRENSDIRKKAFNLFKSGKRQTLLAINCLDEGLDVPAISTGFILASSGNPKQFVQRRGRLLRKIRTEGGNIIEKNVNIYDFISFPPLRVMEYIPEYEIEIFDKEIKRFREFSELAINKNEALDVFEQQLIKFGYKR